MTPAPNDLGIDLMSGAFFGGDPYPAYAWMRRARPRLLRRAPTTCGPLARYADVKAASTDPEHLLQRRRHPAQVPRPADDDRLRRTRARAAPAPGLRRLHAPAGPRDGGPRPGHLRRIIDQVCERGAVRLRGRHRRSAAPGGHRRHAGRGPDATGPTCCGGLTRCCARRGSLAPGRPRRGGARPSSSTPTTSSPVFDDTAGPGQRPTTWSASWCHAEVDGDRLDDASLGPRDPAHPDRRGRDHPPRHLGRHARAGQHPRTSSSGCATTRRSCPGAVEEMLRWVTPIKNMARTATRDVELGGRTHRRRGQELLLLYPSANRDEAVFDRPRGRSTSPGAPTPTWPSGSAPTSAWATSWPGSSCGSCSSRLLERLPDLALAADAPPPLRQANFISGIEAMPVTFTPTAPVA